MRLLCGLLFSLITKGRSFKSPVVFSATSRRTIRTSLSALPEKQQQDGGITIRDEQVQLSNGINMQIMSSLPKKQRGPQRPVLLFLHGSFHASWCWTERWFSYFTEKGYPCVALSWRGTGGTPAGPGVKKVKIMEHVDDLNCVLTKLPSIVGRESVKPVVISHSFGGLAVMKILEEYPEKTADFSGVIAMCSVPPSGNGEMTMRYLRRSLVDSYKITVGFAMKRCLKSDSLCRELFFGGKDDNGVSDEDLERYRQYFKRDTEATIDLLDLAKILPKAKAIDGRAPFADSLPPCLVVGAEDDFIVDVEGNQETAKYFGLDEPIFVNSPHDVMLGKKWINAAEILDQWISQKIQINE